MNRRSASVSQLALRMGLGNVREDPYTGAVDEVVDALVFLQRLLDHGIDAFLDRHVHLNHQRRVLRVLRKLLALFGRFFRAWLVLVGEDDMFSICLGEGECCLLPDAFCGLVVLLATRSWHRGRELTPVINATPPSSVNLEAIFLCNKQIK